ncbi:MAG TPA: hypothetical protein VMS22_25145 [Candidatus Eisenbacteria bacterium]|nr:hypothetical protein [Candidatus Eisenbacteria bacterium]
MVLLVPAVGRAQPNCAQTSTGMVPIMDLGTGLYLGQFQGGLYPGGTNAMPMAHLAAGLKAAAAMVPRNTEGVPDPVNGKVVMISVGMSNATSEFCTQGSGTTNCWVQSFMGQAAVDTNVNHTTLAFINGARSGQEARWWLDPTGTNYVNLAGLLASQGFSEAQVAAAWIKQADTNPDATLPDPKADAYILEGRLATIVRSLRIRYPNLKQIFFSSRVYAGYTTSLLSPEPSAYEGGFAAKWVIEAQIRQMSTPLNPIDAIIGDLNNTTVAPWLGWGAYLWADGLTPRSDGLTWACGEFSNQDGLHLQMFSSRKVGAMLLDFMLHSPVTQSWFPAVPAIDSQAPIVTITAPADGASSPPGQPLTFVGNAIDPEEGDLTASIQWASSIDGVIGQGAGFTTSALSLGTHWITASVSDTSGRTGVASVRVTVPATVASFPSIAAEDAYLVEYPPTSGLGRYVYNTGLNLHVGDQQNDGQVRAVVSFDTSPIPDDAVILSATLRLKRVGIQGTTPFASLGRLFVDVQTGGFSGNPVAEPGDFEVGATVPAAATLNDPDMNGDLVSIGKLNAAGLAAINKTGRTQFRLGFEVHDNANATSDRMQYGAGDSTLPSEWPMLDVTYLSASAPPTTTSSTTIPTTTTVPTTTTTMAGTSTTVASTSSTTTTTVPQGPVTVSFRSIGAEDGGIGESAPGSGLGGAVNVSTVNLQLGDQGNNAQSRVIASFDTSTLPPGVVIVSATLRFNRLGLTGANPFLTLGRLFADVNNGSFGNNATLVSNDFEATATAPAAASLSNPTTNGVWSTGALDASGIAAINRTGRTQVRLRFEVHDNGNLVADRISFASGDNTDASLWPELSVTYQAPVGSTTTTTSAPAPTSTTTTSSSSSTSTSSSSSTTPTTSSTSSSTSTTPTTSSTSSSTSTTPTTSSTSASTTTTTSTSTTTSTQPQTPVTVALRSIAAEDGSLGESAPGSGVGGTLNAANNNMQVGDQANNAQSRVLASFDTSSLPDGATIVSATLRLNRIGLSGTNPFGTLGRLLVDVQSGAFGGDPALQTSDFQAVATAPGSASMSNPTTNGVWSTGSLDAPGLAAINRTGRTQVRLRFETHDNANATSDRISFATGDHTDPSLRPELDVTYLP